MSLLEELLEKSKKLPRVEREILADSVLSSLDQEQVGDVDVAWLKEADRRYQSYRSGESKLHSSKGVMRELRESERKC